MTLIISCVATSTFGQFSTRVWVTFVVIQRYTIKLGKECTHALFTQKDLFIFKLTN